MLGEEPQTMGRTASPRRYIGWPGYRMLGVDHQETSQAPYRETIETLHLPLSLDCQIQAAFRKCRWIWQSNESESLFDF